MHSEQQQPEAQPVQPQNGVMHLEDRVIFTVGMAPGVTMQFSVNDSDLEQIMEQRRERKQKRKLQLYQPDSRLGRM